MNRALNWTGQAVLYAGFAVAIGVFSRWPVYHPVAPDMAQVKVSFLHHGARIEECRAYTAEEQAKMPPNMRKSMKCGRERSAVSIEVEIDGKKMLDHTSPPSGLSRDGASTMYRRFDLPAGEHRFTVRLKDKQSNPGYTQEVDKVVTLKPQQVMVIDYNLDKGGIVFQ